MKKDAVAQNLSFEEVLAMPSMSEHWEDIKALEKARFEDLFPEKHLEALKDIAFKKINAMRKQSLQLPLKDVVVLVLKDVSEDAPAELLLEITKFVIHKWEAMQAEAQSLQV